MGSICRVFGIQLLVIVLALPTVAFGQAVSIPDLYNTGVDDSGNPLAEDAVDPHYTLVEPSNIVGDAYVTTSAGGFPVGPWLGDNALSTWLTPATNANGPGNGDGSPSYWYETSFDLTGLDESTALIQGKWSSDNNGLDILLNGQSTGFTNPLQFADWSVFTLSADAGHPFVAGVNTLQFVIQNGGGEENPDGPTGVRVEMEGRAFVPEPTSVALAWLGLLGLLSLRRRR